MAFGLYVLNNSNELTMSSDGITYGYIGRATLSSVSQAGGGTILKNAGFSTYTITWAGDILVALPVKANGTTALKSISQSGSTWTITVYKCNGTFDTNGFDVQEATEVYVFGRPTSVSGFGMALYDSSGVVSADLTRPPLTYRGRISIAANVLSWTMLSGVATPAIIGSPSDRYVTSVNSPSPSFTIREHGRGWQLDVSGNLVRNVFQIRWLVQDAGASPADTIRQIDAILTDVNGLT